MGGWRILQKRQKLESAVMSAADVAGFIAVCDARAALSRCRPPKTQQQTLLWRAPTAE